MRCPRRDEHPILEAQLATQTDAGKTTCTYCGSLLPSVLFEKIKQGVELTPTDKDYKVYVGGNSKFYFQHLSLEEKHKFIELYNDKTMKLEYPGDFYVLPFFMQLRPDHS